MSHYRPVCGNFRGQHCGERKEERPMALSWKESGYRCLGCGGEIGDGLARLGSVLCHDCRDELALDATVIRNPASQRIAAIKRKVEDLGRES
jgi:hypothetical protein